MGRRNNCSSRHPATASRARDSPPCAAIGGPLCRSNGGRRPCPPPAWHPPSAPPPSSPRASAGSANSAATAQSRFPVRSAAATRGPVDAGLPLHGSLATILHPPSYSADSSPACKALTNTAGLATLRSGLNPIPEGRGPKPESAAGPAGNHPNGTRFRIPDFRHRPSRSRNHYYPSAPDRLGLRLANLNRA